MFYVSHDCVMYNRCIILSHVVTVCEVIYDIMLTSML